MMTKSSSRRLLVVLICQTALNEVRNTVTIQAFSSRMLSFISSGNNGRIYSSRVIARLQLENEENMSSCYRRNFSQMQDALGTSNQVSPTLQFVKRKLSSLLLVFLLVASSFIIFGGVHQAASLSVDDKIVQLEQIVMKTQEVQSATSQKSLLPQINAEPSTSPKLSYWKGQMSDNPFDVATTNQQLFEEILRLIITNYYDHTGGFNFAPNDFFLQYKTLAHSEGPQKYFTSRKNAVEGLKLLVDMIGDPYSKYLTRQELLNELSSNINDSFLGIGAVVSVDATAMSLSSKKLSTPLCDVTGLGILLASTGDCGGGAPAKDAFLKKSLSNNMDLFAGMFSPEQVLNLPVITAVEPFSPAERSGIVVGDRIVSVGSQSFLGLSSSNVAYKIKTTYSGAENYFGVLSAVIAKPVFKEENKGDFIEAHGRRLIGYKQSHVKIITKSLEPFDTRQAVNIHSTISTALSGGNSICYWQLLTPANSIVYISNTDSEYDDGRHRSSIDHKIASHDEKNSVGYIRLTRFSRLSTLGFVEAVQNLDNLGAKAYIIDVRNNYGGVIQEAMLTASSLLRDPKSLLCFTLNSRGGFVPHTVEEYVMNERYPGYLLSSEPSSVTTSLLRKQSPKHSEKNTEWTYPSQYASLHEHAVKRGIKIATDSSMVDSKLNTISSPVLKKEKKVVLLVNEGTASSAEVFASSLRDNGRLTALVGAQTYGKGLIQHTFPTPDGGGLRLTVAEYLTPKLKHVTNVGGARFTAAGDLVGGGIKPDIYCETKGIPRNAGADFCVGVALDALD